MDQTDYLRVLNTALYSRVSDQKRQDILDYYERYFEEAGPAGVGAVVEELGDPFVLAAELAAEGGFDARSGPSEPPTALRRATRAARIIVTSAVTAVILLAVLLGYAVSSGAL